MQLFIKSPNLAAFVDFKMLRPIEQGHVYATGWVVSINVCCVFFQSLFFVIYYLLVPGCSGRRSTSGCCRWLNSSHCLRWLVRLRRRICFAILPLAGVKVNLLQRELEALTSNGSRPKLNRTWEKPKSPCESFITNDLNLKLLLMIIYCTLCNQFSNVKFIYSSTRLFMWDYCMVAQLATDYSSA